MIWVLFWMCVTGVVEAEVTSQRIEFFGYKDCIELRNESTRVVLGHHAGGRILEYSLNGVNAILLDPEQAGWVWDGGKGIGITGGRFDIGPEKLIPKHPALWLGLWKAEILGPGKARMTSIRDESTGVQLVRDFELDDNSSRLTFTQTIRNISDRVTRWCHWSRTFSTGHGICVVPLDERSKFPEGYIMYGPGPVMDYQPGDSNIVRQGDYLVINDTPLRPKLGMDSHVGWFAYLTTNDLLFVKQYPTYRDRAYNEMAGLTISIWYNKDEVCELEPIGPMEELEPGSAGSFTETWNLVVHPFPENRMVDAGRIGEIVGRLK